MQWTDIITDAVVVAIIMGGIQFVQILQGKRTVESQAHKTEAETEKDYTEIIEILRGQVKDMALTLKAVREDCDALRARIDILEAALDLKSHELMQKTRDLEDFKREVRAFFARLLQYFEAKGLTDFPQIPDKLLETDPSMKAVKGSK